MVSYGNIEEKLLEAPKRRLYQVRHRIVSLNKASMSSNSGYISSLNFSTRDIWLYLMKKQLVNQSITAVLQDI